MNYERMYSLRRDVMREFEARYGDVPEPVVLRTLGIAYDPDTAVLLANYHLTPLSSQSRFEALQEWAQEWAERFQVGNVDAFFA